MRALALITVAAAALAACTIRFSPSETAARVCRDACLGHVIELRADGACICGRPRDGGQ